MTKLIEDYRAGTLSFEELKQRLVDFPWKNLRWPSARQDDDDWIKTDYPEPNTIEEFEVAEEDGLLTPEEVDELYAALVGEEGDEE